MRRRILRLVATGLVGVSTLAGVAQVQAAKPKFLPSPEAAGVGPVVEAAKGPGVAVPVDPILAAKLEATSAALANAHKPEEIVRCSLEEVAVLGEVAANLGKDERAPIIRQIADCLCGASAFEPAVRQRLLALEKEVVQTMPGSDLAAYVTYREIEASETGELPASNLHDRLTAFIAAYPQAGETPAALLQLGESCEMIGKRDEAKGWYSQLARTFPKTVSGGKAEGALRRLGIEGKVLHLALPLLVTENEKKDVPFDVDELRGKVVIVYFWAAWQERCRADLDCLKGILERNRGHGVALLCVNLDKTPQTARDVVRDCKAAGVHVFQREGLEGIVAERFGILTLPHIMLVGRDGVVIRQSTELTGLDDLLQKSPQPLHTVAGERLPE